MAAWRIKGRIEQHHDRFVPRMIEKGIAPEFAERVFEQIRGFGEYGFPESHAASFALIAYATAWVRCHYPEAFVCSLLNAQPMGFYAPATIVSDGKRHGVVVLPVSVQAGNWQCRLEPDRDRFAVRMGLRYVKGLAEREGERIEFARREGPFRSVADFVARTGLDAAKTGRLAEAGALACLRASRRQALWEARGTHHSQDPEFGVEPPEADMQFAPLSLLEEVAWDYDASSHSTRGHPLAPLRLALAAQGLPSAREVHTVRDGSRVRYAGLVICRQQPATAKGAVFMTLEDETGFVNLVLWKDVFAKHRVVARTAGFLGITGKVQSESGVVNLVAEELWVPQLEALPPEAGSRDFH
jgi:error-prone DNA polymerase